MKNGTLTGIAVTAFAAALGALVWQANDEPAQLARDPDNADIVCRVEQGSIRSCDSEAYYPEAELTMARWVQHPRAN